MQKTKINKLIFSIAPMIDITNTHYRYFMRLLTKKSTLYTEMLHHDAVLHSHSHLLPFNKQQHPIVLQLGGSDPQKLAEAALLGQKYGYDQINLNVGCPSPRVQKGSFGACLMKQPQIVKNCMIAMAKVVKIPCTVKCRLGVDQFDSYEFVHDFVKQISNQGEGPIRHFVIHARKAFLKGLNPAQNRTVPPLMYDRVFRLKNDFPTLTFEINGGIKNVEQSYKICIQNNLDGCMVGRMSYENPFQLLKVDPIYYGEQSYKSQYQNDNLLRRQILFKYARYVQKLEKGQITDQLGNLIKKPNPSVLVKPIINLYNGEKYSGKYRQFLSDLVKLKEGPLYKTIIKAAQLMYEGGFKYIKKQQKEEQLNQKEEEQMQKKEEVIQK